MGYAGTDGITPQVRINKSTFEWEVSYNNGLNWESLDFIAKGDKGENGITPHIGGNGNWFIGEVDTGIKAQGNDGIDGENGTDGVGISEIISGESYEEEGYTITPITFKKTDGSEESVNVRAKNGENGGSSTEPSGEPLIAYVSIRNTDKTITIRNIKDAILVDWGDGSELEDITNLTTYSHEYTSATNASNPFIIKFYGNITEIGSAAFGGLAGKLSGVDIPNTVKTLGSSAFFNCYISSRVIIPKSVTSIGSSCFSDCGQIKVFEFLGKKPTLESGSRHFTSGKIIVPFEYFETYKTATDWSTYASQIDAYAMASDIDNINTELTNIIEGEGV